MEADDDEYRYLLRFDESPTTVLFNLIGSRGKPREEDGKELGKSYKASCWLCFAVVLICVLSTCSQATNEGSQPGGNGPGIDRDPYNSGICAVLLGQTSVC